MLEHRDRQIWEVVALVQVVVVVEVQAMGLGLVLVLGRKTWCMLSPQMENL
jgi:hypothetical protein